MVLGLSRSKKNKASSSVEFDYLINVQEISPWPLKLGSELLLLQWDNGGGQNSGSLTSIFVGDDRVEFGDPFRLSVNLVKRRRASGFHKNCLDFQLYEPKTDKAMKGQLLGSASMNFADYTELKEGVVVNVPFILKKSSKGTAQPILNVNIQPFGRENSNSGDQDESSASTVQNEGDGMESEEIASFTDDDIDEVSSSSRSFPVASSSNALEDGKVSHGGANDEIAAESTKDGNKTVKKEPEPINRVAPANELHVQSLSSSTKSDHGSCETSETNQVNDSKTRRPHKNSEEEGKFDIGASEENYKKQENLDQDMGQKSHRVAASHKLKSIMSSNSSSTQSKEISSKNSFMHNEDEISDFENLDSTSSKGISNKGKESKVGAPENDSMSIQSNLNSTRQSKPKEKEMNDTVNTSMLSDFGSTQSKWVSTKSHFVQKEKATSAPEKNTSIPLPFNFDQSKGSSIKNEKEISAPENNSVSVDSKFCSTPNKGVSKRQLRPKEKDMNAPENNSPSVRSNIDTIEDPSKSNVMQKEKEINGPENPLTSAKSNLNKSTSNGTSSNNGRVQKEKKKDTSSEKEGTVHDISGKKGKQESKIETLDTSAGISGNSHRGKKMKDTESPKNIQNSAISSPSSEKEGHLNESPREKVKLEPKVKAIEEDPKVSSNSHRVRKPKGTNAPRHTQHSEKESTFEFPGENVKLESKIEILEEELRETAAVEVGLYSIVAEHTRSTVKVHAPARRLSRFYLHAFKSRSPAKRAGAARAIVSGLVMVSKACGSDVTRLTYWLSNSIGLRAIMSQAIESLHFSAQPPSNTDEWEDPQTFLVALEKFEAWIFSRVVESVWWQALTPHMQPAAAKSSSSRKSHGKKSGLGDQDQGNFSVELWKKAFKDACERICPLRAAGHECGCLVVMPKLVMEQLVSRLDVAMFNAILRESAEEMPTDPVSDPISDSQVLPIPAGKTSFGAGAQLKNAVGNWSIWLTDLFGIDENDGPKDNNEHSDEKTVEGNAFFTAFPLLKALSDLMMLPLEMLADRSSRKEVCPTFGASVVKRVFENFVPDEFNPEPIPEKVFEALDSEDLDEAETEESITSIPWAAAPTVYSSPPVASLISIIGEGANQPLQKCSSALTKSYTSDDELDELDSPINLILADSSRVSPNSAAYNWKPKGTGTSKVVRYQLLREIWKGGE
ncbi:hypothetical protein ACFE04_015034 [Oxalis oulophora]